MLLTVILDGLTPLIDGTRGRKELLAGMKEAVETDAPDEVFAEMIEKNLEKLADMALLVR